MIRHISLALVAVLAVGGPAWGGEPAPADPDDSRSSAKRCWIEPWYCKNAPDRPPAIDPPPPSRPCWIEPWYCKHDLPHPRDIDPTGSNADPRH